MKQITQFFWKVRVRLEIWYWELFKYVEFNGNFHFFCFRLEVFFLDKFGFKNLNFQFKLKFGADTNSNMLNSMVVFTFLL